MHLFLKYSYLYLFTNSPWKLLKFRLAKNFNSKTFCFCVVSVFDRGIIRKLDPSFLSRFRFNFLDEPTWKQSLRRRLSTKIPTRSSWSLVLTKRIAGAHEHLVWRKSGRPVYRKVCPTSVNDIVLVLLETYPSQKFQGKLFRAESLLICSFLSAQ